MLYLLILTFVIPLIRNIKKDWLSPVSLILMIWLTNILLLVSGLFEYIQIDILTILLIFNVLFAFTFIHYLFVYRYKSNGLFFTYKSNSIDRNMIRLRLLDKIIILVFVGSLTANLIQLVFFVLNHGFSIKSIVEYSEADFGIPILGSIAYLNLFVIVLIIMRFTIVKKMKFIFPLLISLFFLLIPIQKTNILLLFVWVFVLVSIISMKRFKIKYLIILFTFVVVFFAIYLQLFSPYYGFDYRFLIRDGLVHLPKFLSFLSYPLVYFTGSIPALNLFINDNSISFTYGLYTFKPLVSLLLRFTNYNFLIPGTHGVFYNNGLMPYNTYTFLRHAYNDFGILGALIYPYVIALLTNYVYFNLRYKHDNRYLVLYSILSWGLIISTFSNHFSYSHMWVLFLLSLIIGRKIFIKKKVLYGQKNI